MANHSRGNEANETDRPPLRHEALRRVRRVVVAMAASEARDTLIEQLAWPDAVVAGSVEEAVAAARASAGTLLVLGDDLPGERPAAAVLTTLARADNAAERQVHARRGRTPVLPCPVVACVGPQTEVAELIQLGAGDYLDTALLTSDRTVPDARFAIERAMAVAHDRWRLVRLGVQYRRSLRRKRERQREARTEARAARRRLGRVVGSITEAFVIVDDDLAVTYANPQCEQAFGVGPAELEGRPLAEAGGSGFKESFYDMLRRAVTDRRARLLETYNASLGRWLEVRVFPGDGGGLNLFFADVTHRHDAARDLRLSETESRGRLARLRSVFAAAPVGLAFLDTDLRYVHVNERLAEIDGTSVDALVGRLAADVLPRELAGRVVPLMRRALEGSGPVWDARVTNHPLHPGVTFLANYHPVEHNGELQGVVVVVQDVSQLADATADAQAAREQAEQASRAKDEFIAVLSHELRTPLNPVATGLRLLRADLDELRAAADVPDPIARSIASTLGLMERNLRLEVRLIDDLLDLSRVTHGKLKLDHAEIDLHELITEATALVREEHAQHAAGLAGDDQPGDRDHRDGVVSGVRLEVDVPAGRWRAWADPVRTRQVFWNLIRNAVKFTPPGGSVSVRVEEAGDDAGAGDAGADDDGRGWLRCVVSDTGIGLEPEEIGAVFDAFRQAHEPERDGPAGGPRQFGGLGLGLTICQALVRAQGGRIEVASGGRGKGATFTFTLPAARATPRPAAQPEGAAGGVGGRLLLIEDHGDSAMLLARFLRKGLGYEVDIAGTCAEARRLAEGGGGGGGGGGGYDVVVSDLGLPDGRGDELLADLRAAGVDAPALALSGYGMTQDRRRTQEAGFAGHLTKPVDLDALEAWLRTAREEAAT